MMPENERNDVGVPQPAREGNTDSAVPETQSSTCGGGANIMTGGPDPGASVAQRLIESAQVYHGFGLNVLTISGAKRPNLDGWQHLITQRQSRAALERLPWGRSSGLAIVCGDVSGGVVCLDFDHVEGDRVAFIERVLAALGLPEDYEWAVISPGGVHVWITLADAPATMDGKGKLVGDYDGCDHVELRYNGHITVAPPSVRDDGGVYRFAGGTGVPASRPAVVAAGVLETFAAWRGRERKRGGIRLAQVPKVSDVQAYVERALVDEVARVTEARDGERNDTLFRAACALGGLLHLGLDEDGVIEELSLAASRTGLPDDEIGRAIAGGLERGVSSPREITSGSAEDAFRVPYPVDALPDPFRSFVNEAAMCVGCPPDMVAVPLLIYAAGTIGSSYRIQIKRGYEKHAVLWGVVIGAPGSGKSPADALAREFVDALQLAAFKRWEAEHRVWRAEHRGWEKDVKRNSFAEEPIEPVLEHFYTTDATIEAISDIVKTSVGIVATHDEIVGWVKSMDAYSGAAGRERAVYLELWAGRSLKTDRKSKDKGPLMAANPVVCVVGGVQPDLLDQLVGEAARDDGFVDRFLWSWPDASPTEWSEAEVDEQTRAAVQAVFSRLRPAIPGRKPVVLSNEAKSFWRDWYNQNAAQTKTAPPRMAGIYAKADVQLARMTLLLHVLSTPDAPESVPVPLATISDAARIVEYHLTHSYMVAHRVHEIANKSRKGRGSTLRQRMLAILEEAGEWVLASDISVALGGHTPAEERDRELGRMANEGLVEHSTKIPGPDGGRKGSQWRLATSNLENSDEHAA